MDSAGSDPNWISVAIDELRQLARDLPLDLYIRLSASNYCHVFSSSTGLDYDRLSNYRRKGVTELYARAVDAEMLERHLRERRLDRLLGDPDLRPEQKAALVLNCTERTLAEIFQDLPLERDAVNDSRRLVLNLVELMTQQPLSLAAVLRLVSHQDYLHYHSVAVSVFTAMLARASGRYSEEEVAMIAWGGLLHDIGATRLEDEDYCDPLGEASGEDRQQLDRHCRVGLEIIQESENIPREVGYIVYQHHELPSGKGGPNQLSREKIYEPALLVAVVDAWSSLISPRQGREPMRPIDAFEKLAEAARQDRLDAGFLALLKKVLRIGA